MGVDTFGLAPWARDGFDDWFNNASVQNIIDNKSSVSTALRNGGGKHELFPVSMAGKAKELGLTAQQIKKMSVGTDRITFTGVTDRSGKPLSDGVHTGSRAGRHFHNKLIRELNTATTKLEAKKIIAKHHRAHMRLKKCG